MRCGHVVVQAVVRRGLEQFLCRCKSQGQEQKMTWEERVGGVEKETGLRVTVQGAPSSRVGLQCGYCAIDPVWRHNALAGNNQHILNTPIIGRR